MDKELVSLLFGLFAGSDTVPETYDKVVDSAMLETEQELREGVDESDSRLPYYAAAKALRMYVTADGAQEHRRVTMGGAVEEKQDTQQRRRSARELEQMYRSYCKELLMDTDFVFVQV